MKKYIYSRSSGASFNKLIKSFFIDYIILILLNVVVAFMSFFACVNSSVYKNHNEIINVQIKRMMEITDEAKLSDQDNDGNLLSLNDMYKKWAIGHILLSYQENEQQFNEAGLNDINSNEIIKDKYYPITIANDYLANIYCNYLPSLDEKVLDYKGLSGKEYYKKVLTDLNVDTSMFNMNRDYPTLKVSFAINLYNYIVLEKQMDNPEGLSANTMLSDLFTKTFEYNSKIVQSLSLYQNEYLKYQESYTYLAKLSNRIYLYSFSFTFCILFIVIPLILNDHYSLGNRISGVIVCDLNEKKLNLGQLVLRLILNYIISLSSIFIVALVVGGINAITQPLFQILNYNITMMSFILLSLIIAFINFIISYIRDDKKTLIDILSNSISLDTDLLKVNHN